MSCKMIDGILKWLKEHETREDLSVTGKNRIQTLKFQLRCVRIFVKWVSDDVYLNSLRTWIKDVEMCLLQPAREGYIDEEPVEIALSSLSTKSVRKKLKFECHRYFELGFSILSFGLYNHRVQIEELVLDLFEPLLEILMHLICSVDLTLSVSSENPVAVFMENLRSLRNIIKTINSIKSGWLQSRDELTKVKKLLENAVFVSCNWWTEPVNKRIEELFCCLVVKIKHLAPEIRMSYAEILKESESRNSGSVGIDLKTLASVDSLVDNLQKVLKQQDAGTVMSSDAHQIEYLQRELSFVKYFLMDPQLEQYIETMPESFSSLFIQVEAMARRASLAYSMCIGQTKDQISDEVNLLLSITLEITNLLNIEIRAMYQIIWKPSTSMYPQTPKLAFLDSFLQSLDELQNRKADSIGYVKNEIEIVRSELGSMRSFVSATIKKTEEDIGRRIVDVAYEAEHVIDLITTSNHPNWYYMLWLSDVTEKIKILRKYLMALETTCSIDVLNVKKASFHDLPMTYTLAAEEDVVGFQDEFKKLINELTGGSAKLKVFSIVGMPVVGKTTLAKKVYEDPTITSYFHVRFWCGVSQAYQRRELLLGILQNFPVHIRPFYRMDTEEIAEQLYKFLKGRRYLIVLDDICSMDQWHQINISFPDDGNGSRVLFTTRMCNVALEANPENGPLILRFTEEEIWKMLEKKVFGIGNFPPELHTIGKNIAKKCEGQPLSVSLIAGILMNTEESEEHWELISESLGTKNSIGCTEVLELAYRHLPDHLKPCFLYLGAFPVGEEIPTKKLVRPWLAEGFVQKTESESLENAAEGYLMDLIARNLVLIAKIKSNGGIKTCRLHDFLYDFSLRKAREENLLSVSREMLDVKRNYRHQVSCENFSFRRWMTPQPYLQYTFFFPIYRNYCSFYDITILPYILKLLRVLDLERISLQSNKLPTGIEQLVLLRYLAIQGRLKYVPTSVANLWRLEVLIIKVLDNGVVNLPQTLWEMAYLRDVCIDKPAFQLTEESFESSCIEKLGTPTLCHGSSTTEKLIRMLTSLRKLKCIFLNSGDNQFPVLDLLSKLESLNVTYHGDWIVQQPCEFSFPSNLRKLTLSKFGFPWSEISKIGRRLQKLEVLKLLCGATKGDRWNVSDEEFRNLKFLKLEELDMVEWNASPDAFPCLEQLVLDTCWRLKEIPSSFGELYKLQTIEVKQCHESTNLSVLWIQSELEDQGIQGLKVLIH